MADNAFERQRWRIEYAKEYTKQWLDSDRMNVFDRAQAERRRIAERCLENAKTFQSRLRYLEGEIREWNVKARQRSHEQ